MKIKIKYIKSVTKFKLYGNQLFSKEQLDEIMRA